MIQCISYVIAKEGMPFRKYPIFHALEERHGVDLGFAYKTNEAAKVFVHYIAESQRQRFLHTLSSKGFYSFLMDGSTDSGNVEDEIVMAQYCILDDTAKEARSCVRYLSLQVPKKADADGLIHCLGDALQILGVDNILDQASVLGVEGKPVLVGGGTDGASVNVGEQNGMKGKLQIVSYLRMLMTCCFAYTTFILSPLKRHVSSLTLLRILKRFGSFQVVEMLQNELRAVVGSRTRERLCSVL